MTKQLHRIRTDVVGSLLRPQGWKAARKAFEQGSMSAQALRDIEEREIAAALAMQEGVGLEVVTDGEMRRLNFQDSCGASVSGYETAGEPTLAEAEQRVAGGHRGRPGQGGVGSPVSRRAAVKERLRLARNVPLEEYRFASGRTGKPVKVTLIGPDRVVQRFDAERSRSVYPTVEDFLEHVVDIERRMVGSLVDAGCRYVGIDAPGYTAYMDPASIEVMRSRGEDPQANFSRSLAADAKLIEGFDGVTFGIHLCRGNAFSTWRREGTYNAIAERLFNELPHDRFLLEYDAPEQADFAALRFLPGRAVCVLGLVSTKTPEVENVETLMRRVDEAARFAPLDQLALSPQCGFAPGAAGGRVTPEVQRRKLEAVVEAARRIWG